MMNAQNLANIRDIQVAIILKMEMVIKALFMAHGGKMQNANKRTIKMR